MLTLAHVRLELAPQIIKLLIFYRGNIQFQATHHLINPWNENKRVQISKDGQVSGKY